jgi:hypothetical protein
MEKLHKIISRDVDIIVVIIKNELYYDVGRT